MVCLASVWLVTNPSCNSPSQSSFTHEFFSSSLREWQERLLAGANTVDYKARVKQEDRKRLRLEDPWKRLYYERYWGERYDNSCKHFVQTFYFSLYLSLLLPMSAGLPLLQRIPHLLTILSLRLPCQPTSYPVCRPSGKDDNHVRSSVNIIVCLRPPSTPPPPPPPSLPPTPTFHSLLNQTRTTS